MEAQLVRHCPFPDCDWSMEEPKTQRAPALAEVFGISADALQATHQSQQMRRAELEAERHLQTHTPTEWALALIDATPGPECLKCGIRRPPGTPDYSPIDFLQGRVGWYSGDDGEICGPCMAGIAGGK